MNYQPLVESMNRVGGVPFGESHTLLLFDSIKSAGSVQYAFLAVVYDNASKEPAYYVASEVNSMAQAFGGGSHFLGVFDVSDHVNLGSSDDWGDPRIFFPKAIEMAATRFNVSMPE